MESTGPYFGDRDLDRARRALDRAADIDQAVSALIGETPVSKVERLALGWLLDGESEADVRATLREIWRVPDDEIFDRLRTKNLWPRSEPVISGS